MCTIAKPSSLGALLLGRTRLAILSLLLTRPDRRLYLRQIIRLLGTGQGAVQRELARLVRAGILLKTREGNLAYFKANRSSPVFEELRMLIQKTAGIAGLVRTALVPLAGSIERAFLYGSVARGDERSESDADLMIIGDVSFFDVVSAVSPLQETLGREINPTVFTEAEYAKRLRDNDHFLTQIEAAPRIEILGGSDDSRSME
jgi:predicted nucleotidyltransferase